MRKYGQSTTYYGDIYKCIYEYVCIHICRKVRVLRWKVLRAIGLGLYTRARIRGGPVTTAEEQ